MAAVWPEQLYAHRAMQRLHLSAVVARWHLYGGRPEEHLTFVSRGAEGTGKTAVYRLACELLAINPRTALVEPEDETAAAVGGRRTAARGGAVTRDVPVIATLPLVVFDDVDKMPAEVRQAFWPYLRGSVWQGTESQERALRPVAAVTYNPRPGRDPDTLLPPGWARRSHPRTLITPATPGASCAARCRRTTGRTGQPSVRVTSWIWRRWYRRRLSATATPGRTGHRAPGIR